MMAMFRMDMEKADFRGGRKGFDAMKRQARGFYATARRLSTPPLRKTLSRKPVSARNSLKLGGFGKLLADVVSLATNCALQHCVEKRPSFRTGVLWPLCFKGFLATVRQKETTLSKI
jgi:hypothetical protein